MNGVVVADANTGQLLYFKSYALNFGLSLPETNSKPVDVSLKLDDPEANKAIMVPSIEVPSSPRSEHGHNRLSGVSTTSVARNAIDPEVHATRIAAMVFALTLHAADAFELPPGVVPEKAQVSPDDCHAETQRH